MADPAAPSSLSTLSTNESIVIDGANSVGGAPRQQFPQGNASLVAALLVFVAALLVARSKRLRPGLVVALLVGGLPGGVVVWALRADAPLARPALARAVTDALDDLRRVAPWPAQPARVVRDDGDVLFPLARYAWPSRPDAGVVVDLRGAPLSSRCVLNEAAGRFICGAGP